MTQDKSSPCFLMFAEWRKQRAQCLTYEQFNAGIFSSNFSCAFTQFDQGNRVLMPKGVKRIYNLKKNIKLEVEPLTV
jgi:hypothetical protein